MNNTHSMRLRASRFLSERYQQRERPSFFADLLLWLVILTSVAWPMLSLVHVLEGVR